MGSEVYPKMGTLFKLESGQNGKWFQATDQLLPDTAGLHFVKPEDIVVTEKIDGTNMWLDLSTHWVGKRNGRCEHRDKGDAFYYEVGDPIMFGIDEMDHPAGIAVTAEAANKRRHDRERLEQFGWPYLILFGELVGPKIQSSGQLFPEREFVLFDVLSTLPLHAPHFFRWPAVKDFAEFVGLRTVPEIEHPISLDFYDVREYVTNLNSALNPSAQAEGIVVRDANDTSTIRRRIAKIRKKDFKA